MHRHMAKNIKKKSIHIKLKSDLFEKIYKTSTQKEVSMSLLINKIIENYFNYQKELI